MLLKKLSVEEIAEYTDIPVTEIEKIKQEKH
jgi:hypothetical protein